jgi:hypothetical protein
MIDEEKPPILNSLLQINIPWKNAMAFLLALLGTGAFYSIARKAEWFREIADRGNDALFTALSLVLLSGFLIGWLTLSGGIALYARRRAARDYYAQGYAVLDEIAQTLDSLTAWQRSFLVRFITNDTMQIKEWEVGQYKAVWGPEVDVLCAKGIIIRHHGGVLEIVQKYWQFLQAFWDAESERLNWPPANMKRPKNLPDWNFRRDG